MLHKLKHSLGERMSSTQRQRWPPPRAPLRLAKGHGSAASATSLASYFVLIASSTPHPTVLWSCLLAPPQRPQCLLGAGP